MQISYLDRVLNQLKKYSVGLIGCSEAEIVALENQLGFKMPKAYREYLCIMGKYSGKINVGTNWTKELKKNDRDVAGNLVAYACKTSFKNGLQGFVSFFSKTKPTISVGI